MIWHNQILFSMNVARWMKQIKYLLDIECWNWTSRQTINIELSASYAGKHCLFTLFRIISFDLKLLRKYPVFNIVLKIYIVVLYLLIYITIGSFMNSKQQYIFYLTLLKSLAQTTKFSLTSFRPWQVLFVRVYDINCQVLPWQGALFKSRHDQLLNKAPC